MAYNIACHAILHVIQERVMDQSQNPRRIARKKRDMTLQDLAGEIGVTVGQMSRIERQGTTYLPHALKLAETLRLPVDAFVPQEGERAA